MGSKRRSAPAARRPCARAPASPGYNGDESPLEWLARRRDRDGKPMISKVEYEAGERLRRDFTLAQMTPGITVNWSALLTGGGGRQHAGEQQIDLRAGVIAAEQRFRTAIAAVGPDLSGILIDVCCLLRGLSVAEKSVGWPQRSAKVILGIALRELARHYGMDGEVDRTSGGGRTTAEPSSPSARPSRIRHWGADDFMPRVSADGDS